MYCGRKLNFIRRNTMKKRIFIRVLSVILVFIMGVSMLASCTTPVETPPPETTSPTDATGTGTSTQSQTNNTTTPGITESIVIPNTGDITDSLATLPGWTDSTGMNTDTIFDILPGTNSDTLPGIFPDTDSDTIVDIFPEGTDPDSESDTDFIIPDVTTPDSDDIITTDPIPGTSDSGSATEAPTQTESSTPTETEPATQPPLEEGVRLFADGKFQANVIRKEIADAYAKTFYNEIRSLIKSKVDSQPALKTDFVGVGKELDDGPAILIGDTDYPESKEVYKKLKANQAKAVVVGNKYVIAYTTEASAVELLAQLKTLFTKKATKTEIIIDTAWNKTVEIKGFDESGLKGSLNLPAPSGFSWATNGRDVGQGSKMYIANNATEANYTSYCAALKKAGFAFYSTNTLHTNKFSTYVTKQQIVYVMFFAPKKRLTVVVDPRGTFGLPGVEAENIYSTPTKPTEFVQLGLKQSFHLHLNRKQIHRQLLRIFRLKA